MDSPRSQPVPQPGIPGTVTQQVGFAGLGVMGRGMAHCILRAGHPLTVYNRTPGKTGEFERAGAQVVQTAQALAGACQLIFLCLSDDDAVEEVLFGAEGLFDAMAAGSVLVDTSTISADAARSCARRLAARDIAYLDAPVSGGARGAAQGTLSTMVGGDAGVLEKCRPVMAAYARRIVHMGDVGAGQATKACNQIAVSCAMMGVVEAFVLARKEGVAAEKLREVLLGGTARSYVLENNAERLLTRDFQPGFRAALMRKDLDLALHAAQRTGADLPATALMLQMLESVCLAGDGELDWTVLGRRLEQCSGLTVD